MNARLRPFVVSVDEAKARRRLLLDREGAALALQEHRTEALTWIRRYRATKKRLRELNKQLEE
jgi:hypothetical protein